MMKPKFARLKKRDIKSMAEQACARCRSTFNRFVREWESVHDDVISPSDMRKLLKAVLGHAGEWHVVPCTVYDDTDGVAKIGKEAA